MMNIDRHQAFCPLLELSPHQIRESTTNYFSDATAAATIKLTTGGGQGHQQQGGLNKKPNRLVKKTIYQAQDMATGESHDVWVVECKAGPFASVGSSETWNNRLRSLMEATAIQHSLHNTPMGSASSKSISPTFNPLREISPLVRIDDGYTAEQPELALKGEAVAVLVTERCAHSASECYENGTLNPELFCLLVRTLRRGLQVLHDAGTLHGGFCNQYLQGSTTSSTSSSGKSPIMKGRERELHQLILMGLSCLCTTTTTTIPGGEGDLPSNLGEGDCWKLTNYAFYSATHPLEALQEKLPIEVVPGATSAKKKAELSDAFSVLEAVLLSKCGNTKTATPLSLHKTIAPSSCWSTEEILRCATSVEVAFQQRPVLPSIVDPNIKSVKPAITTPTKPTTTSSTAGGRTPLGNKSKLNLLKTKKPSDSSSTSHDTLIEKKKTAVLGRSATISREKENAPLKYISAASTKASKSTTPSNVVPEPAPVSRPVLGLLPNSRQNQSRSPAAAAQLARGDLGAKTPLIRTTTGDVPIVQRREPPSLLANTHPAAQAAPTVTNSVVVGPRSRSPSPVIMKKTLAIANTANQPAETNVTATSSKISSPVENQSPFKKGKVTVPVRRSPSPRKVDARGVSPAAVRNSKTPSASTARSLSPASTCSLDDDAAQHRANLSAARRRLADVCASIRTPPVVPRRIPKPGSSSIDTEEDADAADSPQRLTAMQFERNGCSSPEISRALSFGTSTHHRNQQNRTEQLSVQREKTERLRHAMKLPSIPPLPSGALLHKHRLAESNAQQSRMLAQGFELGGSPPQPPTGRGGLPQSRLGGVSPKRLPVEITRSRSRSSDQQLGPREECYRIGGPTSREAWKRGEGVSEEEPLDILLVGVRPTIKRQQREEEQQSSVVERRRGGKTENTGCCAVM